VHVAIIMDRKWTLATQLRAAGRETRAVEHRRVAKGLVGASTPSKVGRIDGGRETYSRCTLFTSANWCAVTPAGNPRLLMRLCFGQYLVTETRQLRRAIDLDSTSIGRRDRARRKKSAPSIEAGATRRHAGRVMGMLLRSAVDYSSQHRHRAKRRSAPGRLRI